MRLIRTLKVAKAVSQRAAGRGFAKENKLRQHFFHCVQTYRVNLTDFNLAFQSDERSGIFRIIEIFALTISVKMN